jgi:hypothetical protein
LNRNSIEKLWFNRTWRDPGSTLSVWDSCELIWDNMNEYYCLLLYEWRPRWPKMGAWYNLQKINFERCFFPVKLALNGLKSQKTTTKQVFMFFFQVHEFWRLWCKNSHITGLQIIRKAWFVFSSSGIISYPKFALGKTKHFVFFFKDCIGHT